MEPISFTEIIVSLISLAGVVISAIAVALINRKVQDTVLREVLSNAVKNGVGAIQQGATKMVVAAEPQLVTGLIPAKLVPGVQYVLDNAGEAVKRFGQTPEIIASKLVAQLGLGEIETNLAVSASPPPIAIPPMTPVNETAEIAQIASLNQAEAGRH